MWQPSVSQSKCCSPTKNTIWCSNSALIIQPENIQLHVQTVIRLLFVLFVYLLHAVHFFLTCWTERIDICRGAAACCSKASWFHSRCAAGARVDYKEQCGLVATSHTFIPGQRKGIKWKHSSLFVVIPSVRSHMNTLVELKPCHRSPTNFVSSLLTLLWTQWIICFTQP